MPRTWRPTGNKCPTDIDGLREALTALAKKRTGLKLVDDKYKRDHLFLGHTKGDIGKLGAALAKLRDVPLSTLMISSMDTTAKAEVLNWIEKVPARMLTFAGGTWTLNNRGSAVDAANTYKFATVDLAALKAMSRDDVVKKSRKWCKVSSKKPKVACQFDSDGTPLIYHLDY